VLGRLARSITVRRGGPDDEHDLALRRRVAVALRELRSAAANYLLVHLRQLAAYGDRPLGIELGEHAKRGRNASRRLERDERGLARAREDLAQLATLARQEPREAPAVTREPRGDQRRDHGGRARQDLDRD